MSNNLKSTRINKTKEELIDNLKTELLLIEEYCKYFDEGKEYYAKEIATKLRVLFHNTNFSKSLFSQLKLTHVLLYDSCSSYDPRNQFTQHGLIVIKLSRISAKFEAKGWRNISHSLKLVSFENWWENKKIIIDKMGKSFNRRKLILEVANTDGGAHIDSSLEEDYHNLSKSNSLGWVKRTIATGETTFLNNPVPPHLRQIATEVLESFKLIDIETESKLYK